MKRLLPLLALILAGCASSVTVVHFTDYHSHAAPFFVRGEHDAAGVARAYAYIEPLSKRDDVIVLNGGDTMNLGAPPWSDRFMCVEWPWWNGVVDAMAWGNHDADYGPAEFAKCQATVDYPILGANVRDSSGAPLFLHDSKPYLVVERAGRRIGLFAIVGSDFPALIKPRTSPVAGVTFSGRIEAARSIVRALREDEHVDAVVLFGHAHNEEDEALARSVPGIDLILGTHSHKATPLRKLEGTETWMIASGQYLEHVSRVELEFRRGRVADVRGGLVAMTAGLPEDPVVAGRVRLLQGELVSDPAYASLFKPFGRVSADLPNERVNEMQTPLGSFVMEEVRRAAHADIAFSTSSSFRGGLPAGPVSDADLLDVLPYDNSVFVYDMTATELDALLSRARRLKGSDSFVQLSGIGIDESARSGNTYRVATTDYVARVSPAWKDLFETMEPEPTSLLVRAVVRRALEGD